MAKNTKKKSIALILRISEKKSKLTPKHIRALNSNIKLNKNLDNNNFQNELEEFHKTIDEYISELGLLLKQNKSEENLDFWLQNKIEKINYLSKVRKLVAYKYLLNIFEIRQSLISDNF